VFLHSFSSLCFLVFPNFVTLETEEETLEREQNDCDILEGLGEYKCDTGILVKNVSLVVNIKTLNGRFIEHITTQVLCGVDGGCGKECGKEEERF
jgi:hypothetical protein